MIRFDEEPVHPLLDVDRDDLFVEFISCKRSRSCIVIHNDAIEVDLQRFIRADPQFSLLRGRSREIAEGIADGGLRT